MRLLTPVLTALALALCAAHTLAASSPPAEPATVPLAASSPPAAAEPATAATAQEETVSYGDAKQSLIDRLRLLEPDYDREHAFKALRDVGGGVVARLDQVPDDVVRVFELTGKPPKDDAAQGYVPDRWRARMTLRVRYPVADPDRAEEQIASDLPLITHALIHPAWPAAWHESIESVAPPDLVDLVPLAGDEGPRALVLTVGFDLIYTDTGAA
ncbi:MAG: hypothetical protein EKK55_14760 [Rhodocyclaceae bacterium]|nr:MAG: hypothetical protein EKK55_14760 [Rhodocyclaceae bacterium]